MRHKEFNPIVVLERSITLFWNMGYGGCAIGDIVDATGVNRYSLYDTFESKEGLLIRSLEFYHERYGLPHLDYLTTGKPLRESLRDFYESYFHEFKGRPAGCYILHTATELADANAAVRATLDKYIHEIEARMLMLLEANESTQKDKIFLMRQLIGLFCTSISFCLIHNYEERVRLVDNGIHVILDKQTTYAQTNP